MDESMRRACLPRDHVLAAPPVHLVPNRSVPLGIETSCMHFPVDNRSNRQ
jgi:hypothetical protein